jgi:hypothetical protein
MRSHIVLGLTLLLSNSLAFAGDADLITAGANLLLNYSQTSKEEKIGGIGKEEIKGCCLLRGTILKLESMQGKLVEEQTLTETSFSFKDLKADKYNLTVRHPRYKNSVRMTNLTPGADYKIDVEDSKDSK